MRRLFNDTCHVAEAEVMLSGRDADLAERLREAAASGHTSLVIQLLESGASFIVDSVRFPFHLWNCDHSLKAFIEKKCKDNKGDANT